MATIHIPKTVKDLKAGLGGLDRLLTAKQWERAAIIFAWTQPTPGRPRKETTGNAVLSLAAFARLGITGLRDPDQVAAYRKAWLDGGGRKDIKPGDDVELPEAEWGDHFTSRGGASTDAGRERIAREVMAAKPSLVAEAAKAVPAVAEAVVLAVVNDDELEGMHDRARLTRHEQRRGQPVTRVPSPYIHQPNANLTAIEYGKVVAKAIFTVLEALRRERNGEWDPNAGAALGLAYLHLMLNDRAKTIKDAQPAVLSDIDDFLAANRKGND